MMKQVRPAFLILVVALSGTCLAPAADELGENPYEPQLGRYQTDLLIVGGASGGAAVA